MGCGRICIKPLSKPMLIPHNKTIRSWLTNAWWRHQMEAFFRVTGPLFGEFTAQRPVGRSFDVFFDLLLNKRLSKQFWGWWFETLSSPLWRHCNGFLCTRSMRVFSSKKIHRLPLYHHIDRGTSKLTLSVHVSDVSWQTYTSLSVLVVLDPCLAEPSACMVCDNNYSISQFVLSIRCIAIVCWHSLF